MSSPLSKDRRLLSFLSGSLRIIDSKCGSIGEDFMATLIALKIFHKNIVTQLKAGLSTVNRIPKWVVEGVTAVFPSLSTEFCAVFNSRLSMIFSMLSLGSVFNLGNVFHGNL